MEEINNVALSLLKIAKDIPGLNQHIDAIGKLEEGIKNNAIKINLIDANDLGKAGFYTKQGETQITSVKFGNLEMPSNININIPRGLFKNGKFDPQGIETLSHELTHAILKLDPKYQETMKMIKTNPRLQLLVLAMHEYRNNNGDINKAYKEANYKLNEIRRTGKNIGEIIEERIASTSPLHMMWMMGYKPNEIIKLASSRPEELKTPIMKDLQLEKFRQNLPKLQEEFNNWERAGITAKVREAFSKAIGRSIAPNWMGPSAEISGKIGVALTQRAFMQSGKIKIKT